MQEVIDASANWSLVFTAALLLGLVVKVSLVVLQWHHVFRRRGKVPKAFAAHIDLAAHQKAADYTLAKNKYALWREGPAVLLLVAWTLGGGLDALNQWVLQWQSPGLVQQITLVVLFVLIGALLDVPFSLYETFVLEQRFGFNRATWRLWASDALKGVLLSAALGLPILALVLWLMAAAGAQWWLYAWGALVVFQLFVMWIAPTYLMPLFNTFTPLEDPELQARAEQLMQQSGFSAQGFSVMDGSRRSAHANAFFTGFGRSKRVVFFDTLLKQLSHGEMLAVLAHELGHFKHKHVLKRMVLGFATTLAGLALLGHLTQQNWFYFGLGVGPSIPLAQGGNEALALLLFMLAAPVFMFFITPVAAYFSRQDEFQADAYAAQQTQAADLKSALLKLYRDNASTLTPHPWYVWFYASHPPAVQRLARL
jgi:STE24 endopeptidase